MKCDTIFRFATKKKTKKMVTNFLFAWVSELITFKVDFMLEMKKKLHNLDKSQIESGDRIEPTGLNFVA